MENERGTSVEMIHFECQVCGIGASMVRTPTGDLAWLDHMANHADKRAFRRWTWNVVPLPLYD